MENIPKSSCWDSLIRCFYEQIIHVRYCSVRSTAVHRNRLLAGEFYAESLFKTAFGNNAYNKSEAIRIGQREGWILLQEYRGQSVPWGLCSRDGPLELPQMRKGARSFIPTQPMPWKWLTPLTWGDLEWHSVTSDEAKWPWMKRGDFLLLRAVPREGVSWWETSKPIPLASKGMSVPVLEGTWVTHHGKNQERNISAQSWNDSETLL